VVYDDYSLTENIFKDSSGSSLCCPQRYVSNLIGPVTGRVACTPENNVCPGKKEHLCKGTKGKITGG